MTRLIYIEDAVADHPRTQRAPVHFAGATRVRCRRCGEVFNPKAQSFRLQKRDPALLLAREHKNLYPREPLLAGPFRTGTPMVGYRGELEDELLEFRRSRLADYVDPQKLFPCTP